MPYIIGTIPALWENFNGFSSEIKQFEQLIGGLINELLLKREFHVLIKNNNIYFDQRIKKLNTIKVLC